MDGEVRGACGLNFTMVFLRWSPFGHKSDAHQCSFHQGVLDVLCILWTAQTPPLPRDFPDHISGPASFFTGRKGCLLSEVKSNNDTEVSIIRRRPVSLSHPAGGMLNWVQAHPQKFEFSSTTALKGG